MNWLQAVADEATHFWSTTGNALSLARVPGLLAKRGIIVAEHLDGRRLKEFLTSEAGNLVDVIQDPVDPLKWGILPHGKHIVAAATHSQIETEGKQDTPRFSRGFWAAFIKHLPSGKKRFVFRNASDTFVDIDEGMPDPPGGIPVGIEFISQTDLVSDKIIAKNVYDKIIRWADQFQIDVSKYYSGSEKRETGSSADMEWVKNFATLSKSDLSRIMIPMDIVARLLKKS